jgi:hypothetical protein
MNPMRQKPYIFAGGPIRDHLRHHERLRMVRNHHLHEFNVGFRVGWELEGGIARLDDARRSSGGPRLDRARTFLSHDQGRCEQ